MVHPPSRAGPPDPRLERRAGTAPGASRWRGGVSPGAGSCGGGGRLAEGAEAWAKSRGWLLLGPRLAQLKAVGAGESGLRRAGRVRGRLEHVGRGLLLALEERLELLGEVALLFVTCFQEDRGDILWLRHLAERGHTRAPAELPAARLAQQQDAAVHLEQDERGAARHRVAT